MSNNLKWILLAVVVALGLVFFMSSKNNEMKNAKEVQVEQVETKCEANDVACQEKAAAEKTEKTDKTDCKEKKSSCKTAACKKEEAEKTSVKTTKTKKTTTKTK
jgi:uncharacterized protein HemX